MTFEDYYNEMGFIMDRIEYHYKMVRGLLEEKEIDL